MTPGYSEKISSTYLHSMQGIIMGDIEAYLKDPLYDFHRESAQPILAIRKYMRDHAKTYLLGGQGSAVGVQ